MTSIHGFRTKLDLVNHIPQRDWVKERWVKVKIDWYKLTILIYGYFTERYIMLYHYALEIVNKNHFYYHLSFFDYSCSEPWQPVKSNETVNIREKVQLKI